MYLVMLLEEKVKTECTNLLLPAADVKLSWHNGQIGAIPVFEDYSDALNAAEGNEDLVVEVREK